MASGWATGVARTSSKKRILVGMETSGEVRRAFARCERFDVWSIDLLPAVDKSKNHIVGDLFDVIDDGWDLLIAHPDCTYLTNSAEWAYGDGPYHQKVKPGTPVGKERRELREHAIEQVRKILASKIKKICVENPKGALTKALGPPTQTIQPYWFGSSASKATTLRLKNLPALRNVRYVLPRAVVKGVRRWDNQTDSGQNKLTPSDTRWQERAATYPGIAQAFADQWGPFIR